MEKKNIKNINYFYQYIEWAFDFSGAVAKATFREFFKDIGGLNQDSQVIRCYKRNKIIFLPQNLMFLLEKYPNIAKS